MMVRLLCWTQCDYLAPFSLMNLELCTKETLKVTPQERDGYSKVLYLDLTTFPGEFTPPIVL